MRAENSIVRIAQTNGAHVVADMHTGLGSLRLEEGLPCYHSLHCF